MADTQHDPFADVWSGNAAYAATFSHAGLSGIASHSLTVVTCMDTRIDPLAVLGLAPGDAKIIRVAGARITDSTISSLVLAVHLLGGRRVLLMPHTDCGLIGTDDGVRDALATSTGLDRDDPALISYHPGTMASAAAGLKEDVARIRVHPLLGRDVDVAAAVYDVHTGRLDPVEI